MANVKDKKDTYPHAEVCSNCRATKGSPGISMLSVCSHCGLVMYCSKDLQRAHWKAGHKQHCIAKADRVPQPHDPLDARKNAASSAAASAEECAICLESLNKGSATTLQCSHRFHPACGANLRKFGLKRTCPLCRTPLPAGPEKLCEDAILCITKAGQLVQSTV